MKRHEGQHAVTLMCRVLTVSRSGYYDWRHRAPSERARANAPLTADVHRVYAEHKSRAGAPRIVKQLRDEGQTVGKHRVARVMRTEGLRAKAARKYKATTNSNHSLPVAPNLLQQDFTATAPNRKWVSDSTYSLDRRRLAVSGGGAGSLLTPGHCLGDGEPPDSEIGRAHV